MKKNILMMATLILGVAVLADGAVWTNHFGFGWRLPTNTTVSFAGYPSDADVRFKETTGLSTFYAGTHESGFSVMGELNINHANTDIRTYDGSSLSAVSVEVLLGIGYAPINSDHLFLAVYGTLGENAFVTQQVNNTTYEFSNAVIGLDVTGAYTFTNFFSVYGSLGVNYLLPGEYSVRHSNRSGFSQDTDSTTSIIPAIGVCWRF